MGSMGRHPFITYSLITICLFLMIQLTVISSATAETVIDEYALNPSYLTTGRRLIGIVSYMFLHGNWAHFLINALVLLIIGSAVEKEIGSMRVLTAYLLSGIVAGLAHVALYSSSTIPLVGASGAIFGVLAILFLLMPFKPVPLFVVPIPAVLVGLLMLSLEVGAVMLESGSLIAHDVHIIGFITGAAMAFQIDFKRALKGLVIAIFIMAAIYLLGVFLTTSIM